MTDFAKRLRELRQEKGMTQQQIAALLNLKQQSYLRYENGTGEPLIRLTQIFGVSSDYLLGISNDY